MTHHETPKILHAIIAQTSLGQSVFCEGRVFPLLLQLSIYVSSLTIRWFTISSNYGLCSLKISKTTILPSDKLADWLWEKHAIAVNISETKNTFWKINQKCKGMQLLEQAQKDDSINRSVLFSLLCCLSGTAAKLLVWQTQKLPLHPVGKLHLGARGSSFSCAMACFIFTLNRQCTHQNWMTPIKIGCGSWKTGVRVTAALVRTHTTCLSLGWCNPRVPLIPSYWRFLTPWDPPPALKVESRCVWGKK